MTQDTICRLCFHTLSESSVHFIKDLEADILETLVIKLDLSISENPVICTTCQQNMEEHFNFKAQCVNNEDYIASFVESNKTINLRDIFSGEKVTTEHICRLCMKFTEDVNILNFNDKELFLKFFPEINLDATDCESICTKCSVILQNYFNFGMTCLEWEGKLHNYNLATSYERETVPLNLKRFLQYLNEINASDTEKKYNILHQELHVKEENMDVMRLDNQEPCNRSLRKVPTKKRKRKSLEPKQYICSHCSYKTYNTSHMTRHVDVLHTENISWLRCDICNKKYKNKFSLDSHKARQHSDTVKKYKCKECSYASISNADLKKHILGIHTDPSKVKMHKCELCDYQSKFKTRINDHFLRVHLDFDGCEELREVLEQVK